MNVTLHVIWYNHNLNTLNSEKLFNLLRQLYFHMLLFFYQLSTRSHTVKLHYRTSPARSRAAYICARLVEWVYKPWLLFGKWLASEGGLNMRVAYPMSFFSKQIHSPLKHKPRGFWSGTYGSSFSCHQVSFFIILFHVSAAFLTQTLCLDDTTAKFEI